MNDLDALVTSSIRDEELSPRSSSDQAWTGLCDRIAPACDPLDSFLKRERIVSAGFFEKVEDSLFDRISAAEAAGGRRRNPAAIAWPFYTLMAGLLGSKFRIAAVACSVIAVFSLSFFALRSSSPAGDITTRLTQAFGSDFTADLDGTLKSGAALVSHDKGGLTFRNSGGQVSLFDNATLTIGRATGRQIEYRIFTAADRRSGRIEFSVAKRNRGQRYVVVTPWYEIHVIGTRFLLEQEQGGALKTVLRDGTIRIESPHFGDLTLHKGQVFSMDAGGAAWRIETTRDTVQHTDEDRSITLSQDSSFCRLVVTSRPSQAKVFINGGYQGITPFAMLCRKGTCDLSVRSGLRSRDTVVTLGNEPVSIALLLATGRIDTGEKAGSAADSAAAALQLHEIVRTGAPARPAAERQASSETAVEKVRKLLDSAQLDEAANWERALDTYQKIAADHTVPPLYRQTALFSHGRMPAEKQRDTAAALKDFGTYCILYPDGMFISEALLRLSELELPRNPASAVEYFCRFLTLNPRNPRRADAAYRLGLLLQQQNSYTEAIRMYAIALDQLGVDAVERRNEIHQMIASAHTAQQVYTKEHQVKTGSR